MFTTYVKQDYTSSFQLPLNRGQYLPGSWEFCVQYIGLKVSETQDNVPVGLSIGLNPNVKFVVLFNLLDVIHTRNQLIIAPFHSTWYSVVEKSAQVFQVKFTNLSDNQPLQLPDKSEVLLQIAFRQK